MRKIFGWLFVALGAFLMIAGILLLNGCDLEGNLIDASEITGIQGPQGEQGVQGVDGFSYSTAMGFVKDVSEASITQTYDIGMEAESILVFANTTTSSTSFGSYNGTYQHVTWSYANSVADRVVYLYTSSGNYQYGVASFNGTAIDISWTKAGSPTGSFAFLIVGFK